MDKYQILFNSGKRAMLRQLPFSDGDAYREDGAGRTKDMTLSD